MVDLTKEVKTMTQQYNDPSVQQMDVLACGAPAAAPENLGSGERKENPNVWKPTGITGPGMEYKARVRLLPRGLEGLKKNLYPSVCLKTHFLKNPADGKTLKVVLCRESLPGQTCPICKAIGKIFNSIKKQQQQQGANEKAAKEVAKTYCKNLWADEYWYSNVLIRTDAQHSEFNNQIKWWKHTPKVEQMLDAPCRVNPNAPVQAAAQVDPNDEFAIQKAKQAEAKKQEFFIPYDPRHGRDFFVTPSWDSETSRVTYTTCSWADKSTPLANTDQEMLAILQACPDLNELYKDMPDEAKAEAEWADFWRLVNEAQNPAAAGFQGQQAQHGGYQAQNGGAANGIIPTTQAPFTMPGAQQQQQTGYNQGAPMNQVSGAEYFGNAAAPANDPLAIGGGQAPAQTGFAAPANDPLALGGGQQNFGAPANDPLAVGGGVQQNYAAPVQQQAQPTYTAPAANPAEPVNDMLSFGGQPQYGNPHYQAAGNPGFVAQTPAQQQQPQGNFAPTMKPQAQPGYSQAQTQPLMNELPGGADEDIDLPF